MCITFFFINSKPAKNAYRLILIANRDEFYDRKSKVADYWKENPNIIGGRDLETSAQGTWMGISTKGKIGMLLNVSSMKPNRQALSRGTLVSDFLKEDISAKEYSKRLINDERIYNGFHLILFDLTYDRLEAFIQTNSGQNDTSEPNELDDGVHGFSNSCVMPYQKVLWGEKQFSDIILKHGFVDHQDDLINELLKLLKSEKRNLPDDVLFETKKNEIDWDNIEKLSSVFVRVPEANYGTRAHTIVLVNQSNVLDFHEYTMKEPINVSNPEWTHQHFTVNLGRND